MAKRTIVGGGKPTCPCWSLRSCPPPKWGADDIEDVVLGEQGAVILLPLVPALLLVGELATNDVQQERGMSTLV